MIAAPMTAVRYNLSNMSMMPSACPTSHSPDVPHVAERASCPFILTRSGQ
jgi:hypothetical protein